jgi:hypothetical protein
MPAQAEAHSRPSHPQPPTRVRVAPAGVELPEEHPKRVGIHGGGDRAARNKQLRGQVVDCPRARRVEHRAAGAQHARQAKVPQLGDVAARLADVGLQQHVVKLGGVWGSGSDSFGKGGFAAEGCPRRGASKAAPMVAAAVGQLAQARSAGVACIPPLPAPP